MSQQLSAPGTSRATEDQDGGGLGDSWVAYSLEADVDQRSMAMKEMERLLREAQRESGNSSLAGSSKAGSSLPSTPCNSVRSTPVESGQASPKNSTNEDSLCSDVPKTMAEKSTDTDWVWDWSSTPGARPPKNAQFKRPVRRSVSLSLRKSSAMKSGFFSWDFLQVFIPSLILTNLVAFGLGVYVGKRLTTDRSA